MLPSMQDQTAENNQAAERDPREELLALAREKLRAGDFKSARAWLDGTIDPAAEDTAVLEPVRANLKPDPGAVVAAVTCGLALLVIAGLTLIH
jgi:hypothetical protein